VRLLELWAPLDSDQHISTALYLASKASDYVCGTITVVDGGFLNSG
jgi:enoyl-[acyl-carrier-protein] reductase (NADH)